MDKNQTHQSSKKDNTLDLPLHWKPHNVITGQCYQRTFNCPISPKGY